MYLRDDKLQFANTRLDPVDIRIQTSWSTRRSRRFGLFPKTERIVHAELRGVGGERLKLWARVARVPPGLPRQASEGGTEVDAGALDALLTRLRELGARDVRIAHDEALALPATTPRDLQPGPRVPEPTIDADDPARAERPFHLGAWAALAGLVAVWTLAFVSRFPAFWLLVSLPIWLTLHDIVRYMFGERRAMPHTPYSRWLPQIFGPALRPRSGPRVKDNHLRIPLFFITLLSAGVLAPGYLAIDAADVDSILGQPWILSVPLVFLLVLTLGVDLRTEWRSSCLALRLLVAGRAARVSRGECAANVSIDRDESGNVPVLALSETQRRPAHLGLWRDGRVHVVPTDDLSWMSMCQMVEKTEIEWRVPQGARVLWHGAGARVALFATMSRVPRIQLAWRLVLAQVSTLGFGVYTALSLVWLFVR